jgi:hypothetical protein
MHFHLSSLSADNNSSSHEVDDEKKLDFFLKLLYEKNEIIMSDIWEPVQSQFFLSLKKRNELFLTIAEEIFNREHQGERKLMTMLDLIFSYSFLISIFVAYDV